MDGEIKKKNRRKCGPMLAGHGSMNKIKTSKSPTDSTVVKEKLYKLQNKNCILLCVKKDKISINANFRVSVHHKPDNSTRLTKWN